MPRRQTGKTGGVYVKVDEEVLVDSDSDQDTNKCIDSDNSSSKNTSVSRKGPSDYKQCG
jgi:hypothetical protein